MYAITTTPGFIIEARPTGEANKILSIFTREIGLVRARAQGIRFEKSKLRYHAQEYSLAYFSFVRGKEVWRMTNADQVEGFSDLNPRTQKVVARVAFILRRLLHGEEPHPELFAHIESFFTFVKSTNSFSDVHIQTLESLMIFRIVAMLGYVGVDVQINPDIFTTELSILFLDEIEGQRNSLNTHINKALKESHL